MAFEVSPTSGLAPYTLSADISSRVAVDGVNYVASVLFSTTVGSCPAPGAGTSLSQSEIDILVATGSVILSASSIPAGSCRVYTFIIERVSDGVVISSADARIDNI